MIDNTTIYYKTDYMGLNYEWSIKELFSGSAASSGDLISGINTALNTALAGGGAAGDIVIPVYIGGDMIDEIVVTAQQRMNLRSGGRQWRCDRGRNHAKGCSP
jgi:hypothetical protein